MLIRALVILVVLVLSAEAQTPEKLTVGSKLFPESWVLGEMVCALARDAGAEVEYQKSLGAAEVCYAALKQGAIDVYPEYLGTVKEVLFKHLDQPSDGEILSALADDGIGMSYPLGFNDGYAMAVPQESPLRTLSDLAQHPELRIAMDSEFRGREDGWPLLVETYGMQPRTIVEMQHELTYTAIASKKVDVINVYTTDGNLVKWKLRSLVDDKKAFPPYDAVLLFRDDLPDRCPQAWSEISRLCGAISDVQMSRANALLVVDNLTEKVAAERLLAEVLPGRGKPATSSEPRRGWNWKALAENVKRHLWLVTVSLAMAIAAGIPLGVLATRSKVLATVTLSGTALLQTIPSLALLAFLVPYLGVGPRPALVALFLYSLLPIVRNTYTGLTTLPGHLSEAAEAIGLTQRSQLFRVRLPMASPSILAGIKTSAVINVGTATVAALVGAGGLGQPILQGIQLLDRQLIFQGAVPAAVLALLVQGGFDLLERFIVPRGLRL